MHLSAFTATTHLASVNNAHQSDESRQPEDGNEQIFTTSIERPWSTSSNLDLGSTLPPHSGANSAISLSKDHSFPCYRLWSFGFNQQSLRTFIDSIPTDIRSAFQELFVVLLTFEFNRISQLKAVGQLCANTCRSYSAGSCFEHDELESKICDEEGICAYLSIRYDPNQKQRKNLVISQTFSLLMGLHQEEALSRFANFDVILPMPSPDFLCFLVDTFLCWSQPVSERYFRMHFGYTESNKTVLLKETVVRTFNSWGELVQVMSQS